MNKAYLKFKVVTLSFFLIPYPLAKYGTSKALEFNRCTPSLPRARYPTALQWTGQSEYSSVHTLIVCSKEFGVYDLTNCKVVFWLCTIYVLSQRLNSCCIKIYRVFLMKAFKFSL